MSEELEALERYDCDDENYRSFHKIDDYKLIKSALERKEKLEKFVKILKDYGFDYCAQTMLWYRTYKDYKKIKIKNHNMTEEEFNLLKEMLK